MASEQDIELAKVHLEYVRMENSYKTKQYCIKYGAWILGLYMFTDAAKEIVKSSPEQINALCEGFVQFLPSKVVHLTIIAVLFFLLFILAVAYKKLDKKFCDYKRQMEQQRPPRNPISFK